MEETAFYVRSRRNHHSKTLHFPPPWSPSLAPSAGGGFDMTAPHDPHSHTILSLHSNDMVLSDDTEAP